jgi:hypothetical protein
MPRGQFTDFFNAKIAPTFVGIRFPIAYQQMLETVTPSYACINRMRRMRMRRVRQSPSKM